MRIIQPSFEIMEHTPNMELLIEKAIRCAYKSEDRIEEGSAEKIIDLIKSKKHESCLEHASITVRIICDRGISHEIVRHRIASYTQESTRYVNYSKGKHGSQINVIDLATGFNYDLCDQTDTAKYAVWTEAMEDAERHYMRMIELKASPQEARSVLPNSTKTEIVWTANVREWRSVFNLRTSDAAHPQFRQIACPMLATFSERWPILFCDVGEIDNHKCPAQEILTKGETNE